jgi:DnaJ like chaperone protein
VLNVDRDASPEEIKNSYKKLANKYHPDKVLHLGEEFKKMAEERFKEIQETYRELIPK